MGFYESLKSIYSINSSKTNVVETQKYLDVRLDSYKNAKNILPFDVPMIYDTKYPSQESFSNLCRVTGCKFVHVADSYTWSFQACTSFTMSIKK